MWRWVGMFAAFGMAVVIQAGAAGYASPQPSAVVIVREGDTLWSVARRMTPPSMDVRQTVDLLARQNRIGPGGTLAAGTTLRLGRDSVAVACSPEGSSQ